MMATQSTTYHIRAMQEDDIPAVFAIDTLSFALPWSERSYRFDLLNNPASRMWVAEVVQPDGSKLVIGMLVLWMIIDEAHIGTIAVHHDFRERGIGEALLKTALDQVHAEGAQRITLEVRNSNVVAQSLYKKYGFEVAGVRKRYYSDNGEDALLMTLPLHPLGGLPSSDHPPVNSGSQHQN